ncbi:hypothetical protein BGX33_002563, partial [Mortierella sp. NVP41]
GEQEHDEEEEEEEEQEEEQTRFQDESDSALGQAGEDACESSSSLSKSASARKISNPSVKTTKTGKIRHKSRKIGVNKKTTAYNRFLQQRSKVLAEQFSNLTPQQ